MAPSSQWAARHWWYRLHASLLVGAKPLCNEVDVVMDGACTTIGTVPTPELLTNLRDPEIPGMYVGNNNWCPATASGDLEVFGIDSDGAVAAFTRTHHVVPGLKYHLHGENAEFKQHGGVTRKDATLTLKLPDDTEMLLLPGDDDMVRMPLFTTLEAAQGAAHTIFMLHHDAVQRAEAVIAAKRAEFGLIGQAITTEQVDKFLKYTSIFGCKGDESVHTTLSNSTGHGPVQVPRDASKHFSLCEYTNTYKNVAKPHHDSTNHATCFGEKVLIDDLGPFPEKCIITGARYARKFTDEATGWWAVYPVVDFNAEETVQIVKQFMGDHAYLLPEGKTYNTMRTDGGSVLRAEPVRDLFDCELITAQASMPRQPEQMGQNESAGRELVRTGNAMRARARDAGLPCGPGYAIAAILYAADLHNHMYTRTWRGNTCPIQQATGRQPNLSPLNIFGAKAYAHLTTQERPDKLSPNGIAGQFIGLARGYNGSKILISGHENLKQAGIGGVLPKVYIHEYTKLGIDLRVDNAPLYRLGRKLLPSMVDPNAISSAYPRSAPEPPTETNPTQAPPNAPSEGGFGAGCNNNYFARRRCGGAQVQDHQAAQDVHGTASRRLQVGDASVNPRRGGTHLQGHRGRHRLRPERRRLLLHRRDRHLDVPQRHPRGSMGRRRPVRSGAQGRARAVPRGRRGGAAPPLPGAHRHARCRDRVCRPHGESR